MFSTLRPGLCPMELLINRPRPVCPPILPNPFGLALPGLFMCVLVKLWATAPSHKEPTHSIKQMPKAPGPCSARPNWPNPFGLARLARPICPCSVWPWPVWPWFGPGPFGPGPFGPAHLAPRPMWPWPVWPWSVWP